MTIPREMLYLADEVFFCGTAAEITPVRTSRSYRRGDGKPGPVTRALQDDSWRSPREGFRTGTAG